MQRPFEEPSQQELEAARRLNLSKGEVWLLRSIDEGTDFQALVAATGVSAPALRPRIAVLRTKLRVTQLQDARLVFEAELARVRDGQSPAVSKPPA